MSTVCRESFLALASANGNLTGVNDAEGGHTGYEYDEEGNLRTITDPNNHVTEFSYDAIGRKKSRELPLGQIETWTYEDCCRASSHTDFNEATITYKYDSMKRETSRSYPDGKTVTTTYNDRGQRNTVSYTGFEFGTGEPYQDRVFTYDDSTGKLIRDNKEDGQYITYAYDEAGNLIETSYSGGHVVYYTHDALDRLETVTDEHGTTKYTYDKVGNRKSMTYPNETVATYEYDSLNRLIYLENKGPDGVMSSYRYTLGPAGNRLKIEEHNGDICDYSYDKLYRLTRESRTGEHAYSISYKYDAFGNREEMNAGGAVTTYDYDNNDRLLKESGPTGVVEYDYDKNGNTISKSGPDGNWTYDWSFDNKLITAKLNDNDQPEASYMYDIDGERVTKTTPDGSTQFLIDINNKTGYSQALREKDASNTELVSYTFGDDLISQERTETSYYHYDGLSSTRALTSLASVVTDTYSYLSFGSILARTGVTQNTFLFTGDMYDFNIGFYYLRARLYNPSNGRFISVDPFQGVRFDPISLHKYLYANNNPVNYKDPTGMFTLVELGTIVAVITIIAAIFTARKFIELVRLKMYCRGSDDARLIRDAYNVCNEMLWDAPGDEIEKIYLIGLHYRFFFARGGIHDCGSKTDRWKCIFHRCACWRMDDRDVGGKGLGTYANYVRKCWDYFPEEVIKFGLDVGMQLFQFLRMP